MSTASISGVSPKKGKTVKFPALIKSGMKPLEWWAEGGLVYCFNPNRPEKLPASKFPTESLKHVKAVIEPMLADMKNHPNDYHVRISVLEDFFNRFVRDVFEEALRQDESMGGVARGFCAQYGRGMRERNRAQVAAVRSVATAGSFKRLV